MHLKHFSRRRNKQNFHCAYDMIICPVRTSQIPSFVCFVALRPKSTAMIMAGRSVHLTTLFHGQA